jgi:hypothetical protein
MNPYYGDFSSALGTAQQNYLRTAGVMQEQEMNQQQMRMRQQQMAEHPLKLREQQLRVKELENKQAQNADLRALFKDYSFDPTKPLSTNLTEVGVRMMPLDPIAGRKALEDASEAGRRESLAQLSRERAAAEKIKATQRGWTILTDFIGNPTTAEEYDAKRMRVLSGPEAFANPLLAETLQNISFDQYRTMDQVVKQQTEAAELKLKRDKEAARQREEREKAAQGAARIRDARDRETRLAGQAGGEKKSTGKTPSEKVDPILLQTAQAFIKNDPELSKLDGTSRNNFAYDLASRIAVKRARGSGAPVDALRAEAVAEMRAAGVIEDKTFAGVKTGTRYTPMSAAAAASSAAKGPAKVKEKIRSGEPVIRDAQGNRMVVRDGKWVEAE